MDVLNRIYKGVRSITTLYIVVLLAIPLYVYLPTLGFDFVLWDDNRHVYLNPYFRYNDLRYLGHFWRHPYEQLYVPISYTLFGLLVVLAHKGQSYSLLTDTGALLDPHVFHAANLLLHLLNVLLVFWFLRRLTLKDLPSLIGALLFAIHPLQVESVAWISELRGLLATAFILVALHLYISIADSNSNRPSTTSRVYYILSIVTAVCGMLSKPSAAVTGLFICITAMFIQKLSPRTALALSLPYLAFGFGLVVLTSRVQDKPLGQIVSVWQRPFIMGDALSFYLLKLIMPLNLAIDYGRTPIWVLSHWWAYVEWIAPISVAAAVFLNRRTPPLVAYGAFFAIAAVLPVLGELPFVYQLISTTADRYMYLPMIGLSICVASVLAELPSNSIKVGASVAAICVVLLAITARKQVGVWQDTLHLFTNAVMVNPDSVSCQDNLGWILQRKKQFRPSINHYEIALALAPKAAPLYVNLGNVYWQLGDLTTAETLFRKGIALGPLYPPGHRNLGLLLIQEKDVKDGALELKITLRLNPGDELAKSNLKALSANLIP